MSGTVGTVGVASERTRCLSWIFDNIIVVANGCAQHLDALLHSGQLRASPHTRCGVHLNSHFLQPVARLWLVSRLVPCLAIVLAVSLRMTSPAAMPRTPTSAFAEGGHSAHPQDVTNFNQNTTLDQQFRT